MQLFILQCLRPPAFHWGALGQHYLIGSEGHCQHHMAVMRRLRFTFEFALLLDPAPLPTEPSCLELPVTRSPCVIDGTCRSSRGGSQRVPFSARALVTGTTLAPSCLRCSASLGLLCSSDPFQPLPRLSGEYFRFAENQLPLSKQSSVIRSGENSHCEGVRPHQERHERQGAQINHSASFVDEHWLPLNGSLFASTTTFGC